MSVDYAKRLDSIANWMIANGENGLTPGHINLNNLLMETARALLKERDETHEDLLDSCDDLDKMKVQRDEALDENFILKRATTLDNPDAPK